MIVLLILISTDGLAAAALPLLELFLRGNQSTRHSNDDGRFVETDETDAKHEIYQQIIPFPPQIFPQALRLQPNEVKVITRKDLILEPEIILKQVACKVTSPTLILMDEDDNIIQPMSHTSLPHVKCSGFILGDGEMLIKLEDLVNLDGSTFNQYGKYQSGELIISSVRALTSRGNSIFVSAKAAASTAESDTVTKEYTSMMTIDDGQEQQPVGLKPRAL